MTVPANIGLDPAQNIESPLHTHDTFFDVWGVRFSSTALGGYQNNGTARVQVYRNGKRLPDPARYVLREHDTIVVGYGAPGSVPSTVPFDWPKDL